MAYTASAFKTVMNLGAPTSTGTVVKLHAYATNDTLATVAGANYFNDAATYIETGDLILVSGDIDGTPATNCYVASKDASDNITTAGIV